MGREGRGTDGWERGEESQTSRSSFLIGLSSHRRANTICLASGESRLEEESTRDLRSTRQRGQVVL